MTSSRDGSRSREEEGVLPDVPSIEHLPPQGEARAEAGWMELRGWS